MLDNVILTKRYVIGWLHACKADVPSQPTGICQGTPAPDITMHPLLSHHRLSHVHADLCQLVDEYRCHSLVFLKFTCCPPAQAGLQAQLAVQRPGAAVQLHLKTFPEAKTLCLQSIAGLSVNRLERNPQDIYFRVP